MLPHTALALGGESAHRCESRSLFLDRFADPQATDKSVPKRKDWFNALIAKKPAPHCPSQDWLPPSAVCVDARLMSRLMVNMGGGAMENASLLLDRYGMPIIPGSAVKASARRMALHSLHQWATTGNQSASDDSLPDVYAGFNTPQEMFAAICQVFGWVERDWKNGKNDGLFRSDLGWACGESHVETWINACVLLSARFGWKVSGTTPWKQLPDYAGAIAFLPGRPNADPGLELDVLTVHHKAYYESTNSKAEATDTEHPVPVYFPVVKSQEGTGNYFSFPILELRRGSTDLLDRARVWLTAGLQCFGIGAKTNAGYGWFAGSDDLNQKISEERRNRIRLKELETEHAGFATWDDSRKIDAILRLADQKDDCKLWQHLAPQTFAPILAYAQSQDLTML